MSNRIHPQVPSWARERYAGKRVTVWGLGSFGGGAAAAAYLARAGAEVTVTDLRDAEALAKSLDALAGLGLDPAPSFALGGHEDEDLLEAELLVKSPAIPPRAEWLKRVLARGVPLTAEIVLGLEALGRAGVRPVLVTGSKGKTTTASLAGAMLAGQGPAIVAGNNERPLLDAVSGLEAAVAAGRSPAVVLEVSSFMAWSIARARRDGWTLPRPEAVVFTGLEPEHLDWHGDLEAYYGAKLSLLMLQPRLAVIPADDPELAWRVPEALAYYSRATQLVSVDLDDLHPQGLDLGRRPSGEIVDGQGQVLVDPERLQVFGRHNLRNAGLAAAAAQALGATGAVIGAGAEGFVPLPHRLELVAEGPWGVRFVNDSTATTPTAARLALESVPGPVVAILGGTDKGGDYEALGRAAGRSCAAVVTIGTVGPRIAAAAVNVSDQAAVHQAEEFDEAFQRAWSMCPPGGTVLLAPGTASYDMFSNFKARGERFSALAQELVAGLAQAAERRTEGSGVAARPYQPGGPISRAPGAAEARRA